jgi:hypothetical protein
MFLQLDKFEIVQSVKLFIDKDVQFFNKYGYPSYLRIQGNLLYISSDARVPNNDKLADYYTKNLIIQNGDSFKNILNHLYKDTIPQFVENIFLYPDDINIRATISNLPEIVQRELLTASIQAEILYIQKNKDTRQKILNFFKGFYDKINNIWVVWLYKENFGIICFENNKWVQCRAQVSAVEKHITRKKTEMSKSPIGFYGLYNPQLNEFCLRDVSNLKDTGDLRKITIGRRCMDWDQKTLLDLVVRRIKMDPPSDFMDNVDIEDYDSLSETVNRSKYAKIPEDTQNIKAICRFLYWVKKARIDLCSVIQKWLRDNNLIEENLIWNSTPL